MGWWRKHAAGICQTDILVWCKDAESSWLMLMLRQGCWMLMSVADRDADADWVFFFLKTWVTQWQSIDTEEQIPRMFWPSVILACFVFLHKVGFWPLFLLSLRRRSTMNTWTPAGTLTAPHFIFLLFVPIFLLAPHFIFLLFIPIFLLAPHFLFSFLCFSFVI